MSKLIQVPDEVYEAVIHAARRAGKTPEELVATSLSERYLPHREVEAKADIARRKVNGFLLRFIGEMLCAGDRVEPDESNDRSYWRVPVWVATPDRGPIEQIGELHVEAQTNEVIADDTICHELRSKARAVLSN